MPLHAQICGTVHDANNAPIEFANVALYRKSDSTLIAGTITNKEGFFSLSNDLSSNSFLRISFIGYETKEVEAVANQHIELKPEATELGELVVNGNMPRIRVRDDALVTTVEKTVLSKAGTADDLLKRLPAVSGDNGVYEIFGKGAAKIFINNREMRDPSELDRISSTDIRGGDCSHNPGTAMLLMKRHPHSPYARWRWLGSICAFLLSIREYRLTGQPNTNYHRTDGYLFALSSIKRLIAGEQPRQTNMLYPLDAGAGFVSVASNSDCCNRA